MGAARKPEEFDSIGEGNIWRLTGGNESDTKVDLYYRAGELSVIAEVGGDGAFHSGEVPLPVEFAATLRDNLDAWIRWRGLKSRSRPEHRFCPVHGTAWQRAGLWSEGSVPAVKRYVCPEGDVWRTVSGSAALIPWDEEV